MRAVSIRVITAIAVAACSSCSSSDELVVQIVDSLPRPFNTGPIPGVRVQVNDSDWVTTDANGTVTFTNVAPPFTVRAVLTSTTASVESSVVRGCRGSTPIRSLCVSVSRITTRGTRASQARSRTSHQMAARS
jgi:hypothetical protein